MRAAHARLEPFVGKSGKKIDVGLGGTREDTFITNVRKCLVEGESKEDRDASIEFCVKTYLQPEMDAIDRAHKEAGIKQAALSPIGADAAMVLFGRGNMAKLHGTVFTKVERDAMIRTAESLMRGSGGTEEEFMGEST